MSETPPTPVDMLRLGIAGEHLVCVDLLLAGYTAFLTDQLCPYDVAVEVDSHLLRVQVKTTLTHKPLPQRAEHTPSYVWHTRRAGKGSTRQYAAGAFDLLALVALDRRLVAYMATSHNIANTVHMRVPDFTYRDHSVSGGKVGKQFSDFTLDRALREMGQAA